MGSRTGTDDGPCELVIATISRERPCCLAWRTASPHFVSSLSGLNTPRGGRRVVEPSTLSLPASSHLRVYQHCTQVRSQRTRATRSAQQAPRQPS